MKKIICIFVIALLVFACGVSALAEKPFSNTLKKGDIDADGNLNASDYFIAKSACVGKVILSAEQLMRADVNNNGNIDAFDYFCIKRACLGMYEMPDVTEPDNSNPDEDKSVYGDDGYYNEVIKP